MKRSLIGMIRALAMHWPMLAIAMALIGGLGLAGAYLAGQQQAYEDAAGEGARCREFARQILQIRAAGPTVVETSGSAIRTSGNVEDGSAKIGSSADVAGIPAENIDRIEHDDGQRVGSSPYVRRQTEISLRGVTLKQVVDFVDELDAGPTPLVAESLSLSPANSSAGDDQEHAAEHWDVIMSVVSMRYEPTALRGAMARDDR